MKNGVIKDIGPDGKAQVTVEYEGDKPKRIKTIVVSVQHSADKDLDVLRNEVIAQVLWPVFEKYPFDDETEILINPSGRFVEGGPAADTGLTGRKIMVDTYGGLAAHGGGAFSGKDPTKVDRSGAYMARAIAKNIVRCGFAKRCQVAISYAIGKADPVALEIDTFGRKYPLSCSARCIQSKTCSHYRKAKADGCYLCRYSYLRPFQIWIKLVGIFRLLYRTKGGGK